MSFDAVLHLRTICVRDGNFKLLRSLGMVFLNFYGAQESIPPAFVAWRAGTTNLFLLGS
jgi:hypothetical protein